MSMERQQPCRRCLRFTLADAVRNTRLARRLSIQRAARLAGLDVRQWLALEAAEWIPDDGPEPEAITRAVKGERITASFYAAVSRDNQ